MKILYQSSCSNVYIKPPISMQLHGDLTIYSSAYDVNEINDSFIQLEFLDGNVRIHPDKLILIGNKEKVCVQFLNFLRTELIFVQEHCHINLNNYMMVTKEKPIKISLNQNKDLTESEDWLYLKRIYDRYANLKVFW